MGLPSMAETKLQKKSVIDISMFNYLEKSQKLCPF